jgi:hypothetical protein
LKTDDAGSRLRGGNEFEVMSDFFSGGFASRGGRAAG